MSKFHCEACGKKAERLAMRNSDGLMVCKDCVPPKEYAELAKNLREGTR